MKKHGFVPLIGIRSHIHFPTDKCLRYRGWRIGLYFVMIAIEPGYLSINYAGYCQYAIEWGKGYRPRFTTWKNNLLYSKGKSMKSGKLKYFWKNENKK